MRTVQQQKKSTALDKVESLAREIRQERVEGCPVPAPEEQQRIYALLMETGELTGAIPLTVSVKETAQILGVPTSVAYRLVRRTDFPSLRIGEQGWAVRAQEILPWLEKESRKQKV